MIITREKRVFTYLKIKYDWPILFFSIFSSFFFFFFWFQTEVKIEVGDLEEGQISSKEQNMKSKECQIDIESELDDPTMGK